MSLRPTNLLNVSGDELRAEYQRVFEYPAEWIAAAYLTYQAHRTCQRNNFSPCEQKTI